MPRKRRSKSIYIAYSFILIAVSALLYTGLYLYKKNNQPDKKFQFSDCDRVRFANMPISPCEKLNDLNEIHLLHAQRNGITPFCSNREFDAKIGDYEKRYILVKVTDSRFYQLKSLSHSLPYLIPEAVDMLNEIGYRFQEQLVEKKYHNYRFRITSLLRTLETQGKLCHRNRNATEHSAHLYGTTVDISYKNFYSTEKDTIEASYEAVQTLTKVLSEMRKECRLLVVRERKQACFHITVVCCKPGEY
ncbi:MAG TPA: DUF5715 family protein [Paludibacter sp.]|nr:DUF5715 family protein [Paludibacter sp.]